jgi:hypothetical protein
LRSPHGVPHGLGERLLTDLAHGLGRRVEVVDLVGDPEPVALRRPGLELVDHRVVLGVHDLECRGRQAQDHAATTLPVEAQNDLESEHVAVQRPRRLVVVDDEDGSDLARADRHAASAARSISARSIFCICSIACIARCERPGSGSPRRSIIRCGMICHDRP